MPHPSRPPVEFDEDELHIHSLLSVLRAEVTRVSFRFGERVSHSIVNAGDSLRAAPHSRVLTSVVTQTLNMLAAAFGQGARGDRDLRNRDDADED